MVSNGATRANKSQQEETVMAYGEAEEMMGDELEYMPEEFEIEDEKGELENREIIPV